MYCRGVMKLLLSQVNILLISGTITQRLKSCNKHLMSNNWYIHKMHLFSVSFFCSHLGHHTILYRSCKTAAFIFYASHSGELFISFQMQINICKLFATILRIIKKNWAYDFALCVWIYYENLVCHTSGLMQNTEKVQQTNKRRRKEEIH